MEPEGSWPSLQQPANSPVLSQINPSTTSRPVCLRSHLLLSCCLGVFLPNSFLTEKIYAFLLSCVYATWSFSLHIFLLQSVTSPPNIGRKCLPHLPVLGLSHSPFFPQVTDQDSNPYKTTGKTDLSVARSVRVTSLFYSEGARSIHENFHFAVFVYEMLPQFCHQFRNARHHNSAFILGD